MIRGEGQVSMWKFYAVLSAVFAALTAILAKKGVDGVDSNLATAIRTTVILIITWGIVLVSGTAAGIRDVSQRCVVFLVLSGIATGLSWLFYFKALQGGPASMVAPIDKLSVAITIVLGMVLLGEQPGWRGMIGGALILAGSLVMVLPGK